METAEQRKERLKAMRQAAQETEGTDATTAGGDADHNGEDAAPVLKFRNYALRDEKIDHEKACWVCRACVYISTRLATGGSGEGARFSGA